MDLKLPHLGEGADSGTVVNLFVKEGDQLTMDQAILELENEKAVATIPSTAAGRVTKIYVKPGEKISVGQRILALTETAAALQKAPAQAEESKTRVPETEAAEETSQREEPEPIAIGEEPKTGLAPAAAPSLRKLARDLGIDLTK